MRLVDNDPFAKNGFFRLKDEKWLEKQRVAGKIAALAILQLKNAVEEKTTKSLIELNNIIEEFIVNNGCMPTFRGYRGFPAGVCISVNHQLVHGIPVDYKLQEGDIVSFDLGTTYEGAIADTAITCIYGNPKSEKHVQLIKDTHEALKKAISSIEVGKKIGVIGYTIHKYAKSKGYNVIETYGGHGIDMTDDGVGIPHSSPFIANKSDINEGIRVQPGLVIAIEPMLGVGSNKTRLDSDGWTVYTEEIFCHLEHTVFIHKDHVEVITAHENTI
jgi:methionyl aminopeptidase